MSATERLRAMLDERGVEHFDGTETTLWGYEPTGESTGAYRFAADETSGGRMQVRMFNITPEQAIEATLGSNLAAENDKRIYDRCLNRVGQLEAENEKLRELVRELYDELDAATQYDAGGGRGVVHEFSDRMRELGVEV